MERFLKFAAVGFIAQLIDGSVGMGYGMTSTSLLLATGVAPAIASASVHMAEIVTSAASGTAHWRLGNVDRKVVIPLAIPGAVGGFSGAFFLSRIPVTEAKVLVAVLLLGLGLYVLYRFARHQTNDEANPTHLRRRFLAPVGLVGGFVDATGGGGWGAITTSTLLAKTGRPRKVVGSVSVSEFVVTLSATLGFVIALGWEGINLTWFVALVAGGIFAAPIAAALTRIIPAQRLGLMIAGIILLTNARTIAVIAGADRAIVTMFFAAVVALWILMVGQAIHIHRRTRAEANGDRVGAVAVGVDEATLGTTASH